MASLHGDLNSQTLFAVPSLLKGCPQLRFLECRSDLPVAATETSMASCAQHEDSWQRLGQLQEALLHHEVLAATTTQLVVAWPGGK